MTIHGLAPDHRMAGRCGDADVQSSYQGRDDSYGGQNGLVVTAQVDQSKTIRRVPMPQTARSRRPTPGSMGCSSTPMSAMTCLGRAVSVSRPYDAGSAVGAKTADQL